MSSAPVGDGLRPGQHVVLSLGEKATYPTPPRELCPTTDRPGWLLSGFHCTLDHAMRVAYGITCDDYCRLLAHQGGRCAVCHQPPGKWRLVPDHDHGSPYEIRGLAHHRCQRWITVAVVRYLADPPGRTLGLRVPEGKAKRLEARAAAKRRRAIQKQAAAELAGVRPDDFAAQLRTAFEQTSKQGA
jgi:hypothetical protein